MRIRFFDKSPGIDVFISIFGASIEISLGKSLYVYGICKRVQIWKFSYVNWSRELAEDWYVCKTTSPL